MNEKIPARWSIYPLKDICYFQEGPGLRNWQYKKTGIKFLNIRCIKDGKVDLSVAQSVAKEEVNNKYKHFLLDPNDYVLSSSGTLGRLAKIDASNLPLLLNTSIIRFRSSNENVLDHLFLRYFLQSKYFFDKISEQSQGSAQANVGPTHLKLLNVVLPTLPEQKKIASILNSVDEIIEKTQSQINKLQDLKKGTMNELLTKGIGHTEFKDSELGRIPKNWEVKPLLKLTKGRFGIVDGPFGSNLKTEHYKSEGIPVIQSGFVTTGQFRAKKYVYVDDEKFNAEIRSAVKNGDIVMAKIGAQAGRCAIMPTGHPTGILAGNSLKITTDEESLLAKYLQNLLSHLYITGEIQNLRTETAQPAISIATLKRYKVKVPSLLEQHKIIEVLSAIETKLESSKEKSEKFQFLKKSLMQDLLTGKVRVSVN